MENIAVIIDLANFVLSARSKSESHVYEVNPLMLISELTLLCNQFGKVERRVAIGDMEAFFHYKQILINEGYEVVHVPSELKKQRDDFEIVGYSVEIACLETNIDAIILVSGDADIATNIPRIQRQGKSVYAIGFENCMSKRMLELADVVVQLPQSNIKINKGKLQDSVIEFKNHVLAILKDNGSLSSCELGVRLRKHNVVFPQKSLTDSLALIEQVAIEPTQKQGLFRVYYVNENERHLKDCLALFKESVLKLLKDNNFSLDSYKLGEMLRKQNVVLPRKSLTKSLALLDQCEMETTQQSGLFYVYYVKENKSNSTDHLALFKKSVLKLLKENNYSLSSCNLGKILREHNVTFPRKSLTASLALLDQVFIETTQELGLFIVHCKV